jgi:hypothetical protein
VKKAEARGHAERDAFFSEFCEDYNTCTMVSDKYYDIAAWERAVAVAAAAGHGGRGGGGGGGGGGSAAAPRGFSMLADAEAHRNEAAAARRVKADEQMALLKRVVAAPGRLAEVREREQLLLRQKYAFDIGDVRESARVADKLKDLEKDAAEAKFR